ncbi:MAG: HD domain-containing protein, partial [Desulfobacterales bacterium]
MAAMLHDVGKVGISDTILKKPGRFNDEEREIMKTHSLLGAQLFLDRQSDFDES